MKTCYKCNVEKDITNFRFRANRNTYYNMCKGCMNEKDKNWRKNKDNKSKVSISKKNYYAKNTDLLKEKAKKVREKCKETTKVYQKQYRIENKDKAKVKQKIYRLKIERN